VYKEKKMLEQAQKLAINQTQSIADIILVFNACQSLAYRYIKQDANRDELTKSFTKIKQILAHEYMERQTRLLLLSSAGGTEAAEYSRKMFQELYGKDAKENYVLMDLLSEYGTMPSWVNSDEEEQLGKELADGLSD
jgi:hypothetical protein